MYKRQAYLIVGVVIPMWNGKRGSQKGMEFRTNFGELNSFVLDSLRGLDAVSYTHLDVYKRQRRRLVNAQMLHFSTFSLKLDAS